jgi:phage head maturation protease
VKTQPPREDLYREAALADTELHAGDAGDPQILRGHYAVTNQWARIDGEWSGPFMERMAPTAFDKTHAESRNTMKVLFQHGRDQEVGDKPIGSIQSLSVDDVGAAYQVELFDGLPPLLLSGLRKNAYGASFRFKVIQDVLDERPKLSDYNPEGLPERTITEVAVREFGPVTFPAYEGATASIRSATRRWQLADLVRDPDELRQLIAALPGADLERVDAEDLSTLGRMLELGAQYIAEQDEPGDEVNVPKMNAILADIGALVPYETQEDEPPEPEDDAMASEAPAPGLVVAGRSHHGKTGRVPLYGQPRKETPSWQLR